MEYEYAEVYEAQSEAERISLDFERDSRRYSRFLSEDEEESG
jgi:hypothetical protein